MIYTAANWNTAPALVTGDTAVFRFENLGSPTSDRRDVIAFLGKAMEMIRTDTRIAAKLSFPNNGLTLSQGAGPFTATLTLHVDHNPPFLIPVVIGIIFAAGAAWTAFSISKALRSVEVISGSPAGKLAVASFGVGFLLVAAAGAWWVFRGKGLRA